METKQKNQLVILKQDYDSLQEYMKNETPELNYDRIQAGCLMKDMEQALVLGRTEFPGDAVRLNSRVLVRDTMARQNYHYTLVLPGDADQRQDKISVLAPIGKALFGSRKGDTVSLESARGRRYFAIQEVTNPVD